MDNFLSNDGIKQLFAGGISLGYIIFCIVLCIAMIYAQVLIFRKAGEPGIAAIIPVYNLYVLSKIVFGNGWLFLLCLVPIVNWIFPFVLYYKLGKSFGKEFGFCLGLIFLSPIFLMILGFSDAQYIGSNR